MKQIEDMTYDEVYAEQARIAALVDQGAISQETYENLCAALGEQEFRLAGYPGYEHSRPDPTE
jgi:hypothetical protein